MFANLEVFWKPPNVWDLLGALGFLVGIGSVWFAWWLAKRDIRVKIAEATRATREAVRRVAESLVLLDLAEVLESAKMAREAITVESWRRGADHLYACRERMLRLGNQRRMPEALKRRVGEANEFASLAIRRIERIVPSGKCAQPNALAAKVNGLIETLTSVAGELRNGLWEVIDEQESARPGPGPHEANRGG